MLARPVVLAALWGLAGCGGASRPPNVLLVTLDTTRADALGCYGGAQAQTPTVDALAARGVRFARAYTVTPLTIPAHSSIFTGLYPPRHGVRDNGDFFLGDDAVTLAERLRESGYATMASVGAEVTSHHWGFAQGFDAFYDDMGNTDDEKNRWRVERRGDAVVDDALGWLDTHLGQEPPVFAWVHLFDAHHPYEPPEEARARVPGRPYLAEVSYADSQVARLLEKLRERGVDENTWVIVAADHGEGMGSHGESMHGVLLYDATTHVPLIVRPPGGAEPRVVDTPVSLVDLAPTVLSLAGAPAFPVADGRDLSGVLRGGEGDATRTVYAESLYAWHHYGWAPQKALVDQTHKLIDSTTPELYAKDDAQERDDLAQKDAARLGAMRTSLGELAGRLEPQNTSERAALSPDRVAQLEALGYLTASSEAAPTGDLPDPVRRLPVLKKGEEARRAVQSGDFVGARAAAEAALTEEPGLQDTRLLLATILLRLGEDEAATAALAEAEARQPSSGARSLQGFLLMKQGRYELAADRFADALALDGYLSQAWTGYLHALLISGDMPRLAAEVARARTRVPDAPVVLGMEGVLLAMKGDPGLARMKLEESIRREPTQPFLHHALGQALRRQGEPLAAETALLEEVEAHGPAIASRRVLVELYAEQKRYEEQLAQLAVIRAHEPPFPPTLHSVAQAEFNLGRYDAARADVDACLAVDPAYAGCAMLLANVLKKQGHDAEAQAAFERALALRGQAPR